MRFAILLLLLTTPLCAQVGEFTVPQEITVDLEAPVYQDGVLSTDEGGVISGDNIRIQAQRIIYTHKTEGDQKISCVEAEGDLMVEVGDDVFIGDRLEYDFVRREGVLTKGRSQIGPWYVGGDRIELVCDGSYILSGAFITTCEDKESEWQLRAKRIHISRHGDVRAVQVGVFFFNREVFWLPNFKTNLRSLLDAPIRYRAEVGGASGTKVGMRYRFFRWKDLKGYLRAEYLVGRGPAFGIETEYNPCHRFSEAYTQSYMARDRSINDPKERLRYRFAGTYRDKFQQGNTKVFASYDWLSDPEMSTDYLTNDFQLHTARLTTLEVLHEHCWFKLNGAVRARVNNFQTVNQELPLIEGSLRPSVIGRSGIVSVTRASAGYLNYVFAKETPASGFDSGRFSLRQSFYRPFYLGPVTLLPEITGLGMVYTNGPAGSQQLLATAAASVEGRTRFSKIYWQIFKHVVEPYARYFYWTQPSSRIPEHFQFSEFDAYTQLNYMRFGVRNYLYSRRACWLFRRPLALDIFAYGFVNSKTIVGDIPRLYANLSWQPVAVIDADVEAGWNAAHNEVDHFNTHLRWTVSEDLAFNVEGRYRSRYVYRKANQTNFVLDSFTPEGVLLNSDLSDQRYTLLTRTFFRFRPTMAFELETRHGWGRQDGEPSYNEGKLSVHTLLQCRWHLTVYFEHTEVDNRYGFNLRLGKGRRPKCAGHRPTVW